MLFRTLGLVDSDRSWCYSVADDEVKRFWLASKGDTAKFVTIMRKTLEWRQSFDFMPQFELHEWLPLVFWHRRDAHGRPILIIRLGLACTTSTPAQRPQFAQAVSKCAPLLTLSIDTTRA